MKRQYLGDSKDSFKWDYLHFLVDKLGYSQLKIAWMMTPDDDGPHGSTPPERFPARKEVLQFCNNLRSARDPALLSGLPATTGAHYAVSLHTPEDLNRGNRNSYFSGVESGPDQVPFLDPDNGLEPERSFSEKHVLYSEVDRIIRTMSPGSVVTVFQHFRRKQFHDDFARIRERLQSGYSAAIYWRSLLMFVSVSSSPAIINLVCEVNREYATSRPVEPLA